jgi:ABC-type uncharacterized transport system substrate-binding protein
VKLIGKSFAVCALVFVLCFFTEAQQANKVPRIGYLAAGAASLAMDRLGSFRQGLHDLGYVEGKNIAIEYRGAAGKLDQVPQYAAELVRLNVDVIVTAGPTDTRAAKQATSTIPIVMSQDNDPVGNGFVASLAHPGGNITGLANLRSELSGKRLELLKDIVPKLSRVAVFGSSINPGNRQSLKEAESAAPGLSVQLRYWDLRKLTDIESAFREATNWHAEAVLILGGPLFNTGDKVAELSLKNKLPTIYDRPTFINSGGLMTYGPKAADLDRRAAVFVDKILKGAKPADLPVEQPTKFELVINLKAAKQIGLTIPPNVLARADRVIK